MFEFAGDRVYLVDLGLVTQYKTYDGKEKPAVVSDPAPPINVVAHFLPSPIPCRLHFMNLQLLSCLALVQPAGTGHFMATSWYRKQPMGPRDDLESLGYLMLCLLMVGGNAWQ